MKELANLTQEIQNTMVDLAVAQATGQQYKIEAVLATLELLGHQLGDAAGIEFEKRVELSWVQQPESLTHD